MSLPDWVPPGILPAGRHPASLDELYERCVAGAVNQDRRKELFEVLRVFFDVATRTVGPATYWVDGGFVTNKPQLPFDIDVLIIPDDWSQLSQADPREQMRMYGLLTLQDVIVGPPTYIGLERLQPFAGELDSFLCYPGQQAYWDETWSSLKWGNQIVDGATKGYVEVRP
jgi:hypothetical protein